MCEHYELFDFEYYLLHAWYLLIQNWLSMVLRINVVLARRIEMLFFIFISYDLLHFISNAFYRNVINGLGLFSFPLSERDINIEFCFLPVVI